MLIFGIFLALFSALWFYLWVKGGYASFMIFMIGLGCLIGGCVLIFMAFKC